jgi:hypothetical protein
MEQKDELPEWALLRAAALTNEDGSCYDAAGVADSSIGTAFARYIASHEQDPLIEQARAIAYETRRFRAGCAGYADAVCQKIKAGGWDNHMLVQAALAGLRARKGGDA